MKNAKKSNRGKATRRKAPLAGHIGSLGIINKGLIACISVGMGVLTIATFSLVALENGGRSSASVVPVTTVKDIKYGSSTLDLYYTGTKSGPLRSALILVHGGGWVGGDKSDPKITTAANDMAREGHVVFNINYPLASPTSPGYPAQLQSVEAAVNYVKKNSAMFHVNPNRIGLLGGSAGANLAYTAGLTINKTTPNTVDAVVGLSGPTQLWQLYLAGMAAVGTGAATQEQKTMLSNLRTYLGCSGTPCSQATANAASPFHHVNSHCAPTGIVHSQTESLPVAQANEFANALSSAGCTVQKQILPGKAHSFDYWPAVKSGVAGFFKTYL